MTRFGIAVLLVGFAADLLAHAALIPLEKPAHVVTLMGMLLVLGSVIWRAHQLPHRRV